MELKIEDGVVEIAEYAYKGRDDIEKIIFPTSLRRIGNAAFAECANIREVRFNSGLERIGGSAFSGCIELAKVAFPESVVEIGVAAFMGCRKLVELVIPGSVNEFKMAAFRECSALERVVIGAGVKLIPSKAFIRCGNLAQVDIPQSVTWVGDMAFDGCKVKVPSGKREPPKVWGRQFATVRRFVELAKLSSREYIEDSYVPYSFQVEFRNNGCTDKCYHCVAISQDLTAAGALVFVAVREDEDLETVVMYEDVCRLPSLEKSVDGKICHINMDCPVFVVIGQDLYAVMNRSVRICYPREGGLFYWLGMRMVFTVRECVFTAEEIERWGLRSKLALGSGG